MDRPDNQGERIEDRDDLEYDEERAEQYLDDHASELDSLRGQADSHTRGHLSADCLGGVGNDPANLVCLNQMHTSSIACQIMFQTSRPLDERNSRL